jgi:hypothetical protein
MPLPCPHATRSRPPKRNNCFAHSAAGWVTQEEWATNQLVSYCMYLKPASSMTVALSAVTDFVGSQVHGFQQYGIVEIWVNSTS